MIEVERLSFRYPGAGKLAVEDLEFQVGRGEAWGIDSALAAYACSGDSWRAEKLDWFRALAQMFNDGQGACQGVLQSNVTPKNLNGLYRTRQMIGLSEQQLEAKLREAHVPDDVMDGIRKASYLSRRGRERLAPKEAMVDALSMIEDAAEDARAEPLSALATGARCALQDELPATYFGLRNENGWDETVRV